MRVTKPNNLYYMVWDDKAGRPWYKPLYQVKRFLDGKIMAECTSREAMTSAFKLLAFDEVMP